MKLVINIPEEFERDFVGTEVHPGRFKDFFGKVSAEIKHSLTNPELVSILGKYELEISEMFEKAFEEATLLPENLLGIVEKTKEDKEAEDFQL